MPAAIAAGGGMPGPTELAQVAAAAEPPRITDDTRNAVASATAEPFLTPSSVPGGSVSRVSAERAVRLEVGAHLARGQDAHEILAAEHLVQHRLREEVGLDRGLRV